MYWVYYQSINLCKDEVASLAVSIAEKVIDKEIDEAKHKELIDTFIGEMGDTCERKGYFNL